jgi:hypothetical protein
MTGAGAGWSSGFAACTEIGSPQLEHAFASPATLCGIPEERVEVYRHMFGWRSDRACSRCRERASAAASVPPAEDTCTPKVR